MANSCCGVHAIGLAAHPPCFWTGGLTIQSIPIVACVEPLIIIIVALLACDISGHEGKLRRLTAEFGCARLVFGRSWHQCCLVSWLRNAVVVIDQIHTHTTALVPSIQAATIVNQRHRAVIDVGALLGLLVLTVHAPMQRSLITAIAMTAVIIKVNSRGIPLVNALAIVSAIHELAVIDVLARWSFLESAIGLARNLEYVAVIWCPGCVLDGCGPSWIASEDHRV
jgi:hypothetical protein